MTRATVRTAAVQTGEFAVGVGAAYAVVATTWAVFAAWWPVVIVALLVVAAGIAAEMRFGPKVTGLVAGLLPTALLTGGLFAAFSLVSYRLD